MRKNRLITIFIIFITIIALWFVRFYPQQMVIANDVSQIVVLTPDSDVYHNDCLHPCVRYYEDSFAGYPYWMAQSPYYAWNNKVENPILYHIHYLCDTIKSEWGGVIHNTPIRGYNSDPYIFRDDTLLYIFWRECNTPLCDSLNVNQAVVGVHSKDGRIFSDVKVYLTNDWKSGDYTQCPILMKHNGKYWFYAAWYQYEPIRKGRGIAIWKGSSLENPDFVLADTIAFDNPYVCDKKAEIRMFGKHWYLPWPKKYDLWHFDMFEYKDKLYMVSCAEKDDNIMLSVSEDWKHFKTFKKPLVNNHYMQNHCGYRQYYYKPTAFVKDDTLHLFWTSNDREDGNRNVLWSAKIKMPIR